MLENKSNIIIASILLFLAALFWSGNFIVGKIAGLNDIPPISLNILRWSLAFLILLPFTYKEMIEKKELIFKNIYLLCFLGITAVSIFNSALFYSLNTIKNTYSKRNIIDEKILKNFAKPEDTIFSQ